ncbi:MAG: hypothetical protein EXR70_21675 [Deltaproteobacteria bacterium]|nr:hypothetical protein [Deltaproteobacteria bacterium]
MIRRAWFIALFLFFTQQSQADAADPGEFTACGVVSAADAEKFVGGPLEVKEFAKLPTANAPGAYNSICTSISKGGDFADAFPAARLLDLTLHFLDTTDAMAAIYENSLGQYAEAIKSPEAPLKNATISPLPGFGNKAFVLEAVTDKSTGYKSVLIVFYKGRIGGSIAAWKKPESALETTKAVLKFILGRLP